VDIDGIMNGSLSDELSKTGRAGMIIDIGKRKELGALRTIETDQNRNRGRN